MADTSLYDAYVPLLECCLISLDGILTKAETHAKENGIDADVVYFPSRICEDMRPLAFQVEVIRELITGVVAALVEVAPPAFLDEDKTFADFHTRISKTQEYLKVLKPEDMNGKGEEVFDFELRRTKLSTMLVLIVIPNVFFHVTTAYDILRMKGVPLGKMDYLGVFMASG